MALTCPRLHYTTARLTVFILNGRSKLPGMASLAQLQVLRRQYFSLYPPHLIQLNLEPRLALARNQAWIYNHLVSAESLAGDYPPANDYQRKFWKLLVAVLEDELRDDEAVEEELASLLSSNAWESHG